MLHRVEIAFLSISFEVLRLEREQISVDFDFQQIDVRHEFHIRKDVFKTSEKMWENCEKSSRREPSFK